MESAFWESVAADGHRVPADRPLAELTSELTTMLGDSDPHIRDDIAASTLTAWIAEGVYDQLLEGLGDGMAAGLVVGLGTTASDTVFRRGRSATVLEACIRRDNQHGLTRPDTVLRWGDRLMSWYVRERDLRAEVPGKGTAGNLGRGADALRELTRSPHLDRLELTVVLDLVADRLTAPTEFRAALAEVDALAAATLTLLRRDLLPIEMLDPWARRLVATASGNDTGEAVGENIRVFVRALYVQLTLAPAQPACRADLLLSLVGAIKRLHPGILQA
ncbi:MAG: DUF2785 domain-containing protein [Nocardioidaceae bacterium]